MSGLFSLKGMELGATCSLRAKDSAATIARARRFEDVPERRQACLSVRLRADGNAQKIEGKARQKPILERKKAPLLACSRDTISHPKGWATHARLG